MSPMTATFADISHADLDRKKQVGCEERMAHIQEFLAARHYQQEVQWPAAIQVVVLQ
jgi:hypothetical protein